MKEESTAEGQLSRTLSTLDPIPPLSSIWLSRRNHSHVLEDTTHDNLSPTLKDEPDPTLDESLLASKESGIIPLQVGRPDRSEERAVQLGELREQRKQVT